MASHAVDGHGELAPRRCIHDRLRRLQKIVVAFEWRNSQCHTANAWTEARCPGVGGVDEPISLNRSPVRHERAYAIGTQHGSQDFGLLLHLHAQFLCPSEPLVIDHMRDEEAVGRTPGSAHQAIRFKMWPKFMDMLW